MVPPVDAWGMVRYKPDFEATVRDMRRYIAVYLTLLIRQLDTTDNLPECLAVQPPVEVPAGFQGRTWITDESLD